MKLDVFNFDAVIVVSICILVVLMAVAVTMAILTDLGYVVG